MTDQAKEASHPGTLVEVDVRSDPRWASLIRAPGSDVFHTPAWASVLRDTYEFDVRAAVLVDGAGLPRAGLPFVAVDDVRGNRVVSLPFSDFCDPLVSDARHWDRLVSALPLADTPVRLRCLRTRPPDGDDRWRSTGALAWHRVDTTRSPADMWNDIHPSARRAIRKAQAAGVIVSEAVGEEDLRAFFHMHVRVRKYKYGLLAQPYAFFASIWEHFIAPRNGHLLLAKVGSEVVGGVMYLKWNDTIYYKFNASRVSDLDVRPNDLIVWEGLLLAHEEGLRWLDFGVSDFDQEGLIRYKQKYATEQGEVVTLSGGPYLIDRAGPLLGQVTALLVDPSVPDVLTEQAGDQLYALFA